MTLTAGRRSGCLLRPRGPPGLPLVARSENARYGVLSHVPVFPYRPEVAVCLHLRTGLGSCQPFLDSGHPTPEFGKTGCAEQSGAGLCARPAPRSLGSGLQAAHPCPLGSQVRTRARRRGSGSPTALIVSPSSVII